MTSIYWIITIGKLAKFFEIATVFLGMILAGLLFHLLIADEEEKSTKIVRHITTILFSISVLGTVFIPFTKELLTIYGVGSTIEYIQSSDECKKLPDNVLKACNKFLTDYTNDDSKE